MSALIQSDSTLRCTGCKNKNDAPLHLWVCLTCSYIGCEKHKHAQAHFTRFKHPLAIEIIQGACHCYKCNNCIPPDSSVDLHIIYKYLTSCYIHSKSNISCNSSVLSKRVRSIPHALPVNKKRKLGIAPGLIGLQNLGNTCYMNAVLQVLSHTEPVRCFFLEMFDEMAERYRAASTPITILPRKSRRTSTEEPLSRSVSLVAELRDIIRDLWFHDSPAHSPVTFLTSMWSILPHFYGSEQHDTHEFLRSLLEKLNSEFRSSRTRRDHDTVHGIFQGILISELSCQKCGAIAICKKEAFQDISVDIAAPCAPCSTVTLQDCLGEFMALEELESGWFQCSKCRSQEKISKRFMIHDFPPVLCIHLKRFRWDPPKKQKITTPLDLPVALDLSEYASDPKLCSTYQLYSTVSHHGSNSICGHYTAHCEINDEWFHFNDRSVKSCSVKEAQEQAYLLFYKKVFE